MKIVEKLSLQKLAFKGAMWLALFNFLSQAFSWTVTVLVARILSPADYGLMELATIFTGYAKFFVDLGLGAAIVQRKEVNEHELSSIFWFTVLISIFLAFVCFLSAGYIAVLFQEPRLTSLVQTISLVFPISGMLVVPSSLLHRNMEYKAMGKIGMMSIVTSGIGMYLIAINGGGVWTLVGGMFILSITRLIATFLRAGWLPLLYFNYSQAKSYLRFGANVLIGRTFFYSFEKSDKFFAGRVWSSQSLGFYGFALQLAQIPTEKVTTLINRVSYPVFSKLKDNKEEFEEFYLSVIRATAVIVIPVFVGGYMLGGELITVLLNEKWFPLIYVFELLCITQIVTSLNAVNSFVHYAQDRPNWSLYFHASLAVGMGISFYLVVPYGLDSIVFPWFSTYLILCGAWTVITLNKLDVKIRDYVRNIMTPIVGTFVMVIGLIILDQFLSNVSTIGYVGGLVTLLSKIVVGGLLYIYYIWKFDREMLENIRILIRS